MTEQRKMEIIKALAYGEKPERAGAANGVGAAAARELAAKCAGEIEEERRTLKGAGYIV